MVISTEKKNSGSKGIITQSITPEERKKDRKALDKLNKGESWFFDNTINNHIIVAHIF